MIAPVPIPILLYHTVHDSPSAAIAPFAVRAATFAGHLDTIVGRGSTALTVSDLVQIMDDKRPLPPRPVVITFDDGFADLHHTAAPRLAERSLPATAYVITGALDGPEKTTTAFDHEPMLSWSQVSELDDLGIEVGAHTHSHPELDTLPVVMAGDEIRRSRDLLEDHLGRPVPSFAYPGGYSSPAVRRAVPELGFRSACSVGNALSSTVDDRFGIRRLTVRSDTHATRLAAWLDGVDVRCTPRPERLQTRAWRSVRRTRAMARR